MNPELQALPHLLLEIVRSHTQEAVTPAANLDKIAVHSPENFSCCKTLLEPHKLSDDELVLIALVFEQFVEGKQPCKALEVVGRMSTNRLEQFDKLQVLKTLTEKGIISLEGKGWRFFGKLRPGMCNVHLAQLMQAEIELHPAFVEEVFTTRSPVCDDELPPYDSNQEFLDEWFECMDALRKSRCLEDYELAGLPDRESLLRYSDQARQRIDGRMEKTSIPFPLFELASEAELDDCESNILVYLLMQELRNESTPAEDVIKLISTTPFERHENRRYLTQNARLCALGLIEVKTGPESILGRRVDVSLSRSTLNRLCCTEKLPDADRLRQILEEQSIFKLESPQQALAELVLPAPLMRTLETAIGRYESNVDAKLREWGLERELTKRNPNDLDEAPLLILLSGASGTGKTFAAGAIANRLGKSLLVTDISKLLSKWIGESEKSVRELLNLHAEIIRTCPNPPVLLLNECDQFLSRRGSVEHATDRMYNQMQNLFLEGFEKMRGILIATTNLATQLDEAFSRRFHLKLEFPKPDFELRKALWRKHLLPTIPLSDDVDLDFLAKTYELTGGQIAVVVRNAAIEAAVRGDAVGMGDLVEACYGEARGVLCQNRFMGDLGFNIIR